MPNMEKVRTDNLKFRKDYKTIKHVPKFGNYQVHYKYLFHRRGKFDHSSLLSYDLRVLMDSRGSNSSTS